MEIDELRDYCLSKKGVTEEFPFDEVTLVFKVMNKMFCLAGLEKWERGEKTIYTNRDMPREKLQHWIDHSYDLVVSKLTRKDKEILKTF